MDHLRIGLLVGESMRSEKTLFMRWVQLPAVIAKSEVAGRAKKDIEGALIAEGTNVGGHAVEDGAVTIRSRRSNRLQRRMDTTVTER